MPERIAHIVGKMVGGGVEAVVMNYYRCIERSRYQFDFIVEENSSHVPYEEIAELGGRVFVVPPVKDIGRYRKALKQLFADNDYRIVHSHLNSLSVFPLQIAKKCGVQVRIAHSHSTSSQVEFLRNFVKQFLKPFSRVYANTLVACSAHAGNWLFGKKSQYTILPNAIDISRFSYNADVRNATREHFEIEDKFVIGHVGRFAQQKNHEFLIRCFRCVKNIEPNAYLLLVGEGPLTKKTNELVAELGLCDSVTFVGQTECVEKFYNAMDVFCLPSLYEGLGMVAVEAQISGLPTIVSDAVPSEVVCTNGLVTFMSLDCQLDEWAKKIATMRPAVRDGREQSVLDSDYNIHTSVEKLRSLYDSLIEEQCERAI